MHEPNPAPPDTRALARQIKLWAKQLGFSACGITDTDLGAHEVHLLDWLAQGYQGEMDYMARHGTRRSRPAELEPGTQSVISVRMNYWPDASDAARMLADPARAFVSRYALGRDYHKLMRGRLQKLAARIQTAIGPFGYRAYSDSAPVLEKALAEKAGLGWIGKHSNLLAEHTGSWFFLGELYTDLALPPDAPASSHCGTCDACIQACPTAAIVAPYRVDARRCIAYLTIELAGSIPLEFRPLLGNRIYGCDDCQLVCPWNRFASHSPLPDFQPRHELDSATLITLFDWDEATFLKNTEGSAIRRIGHPRWLRNIAVALGNAPSSEAVLAALRRREHHASELVREHVAWALLQHHSLPTSQS